MVMVQSVMLFHSTRKLFGKRFAKIQKKVVSRENKNVGYIKISDDNTVLFLLF